MKICFVQKQLFPYFGVMSLSGIAKRRGHETDVLIDAVESNLILQIRKVKPDLLAFSAMSTEHNWLLSVLPKVKSSFPDVPIILGGVHATLYTADCLEVEGVDYVCCGEGEVSFSRFLDFILSGEKEPVGIEGISYKRSDGQKILQGVSPLLENLDELVEDREIYYDRYRELKELPQKIFMSSRGCPFNCAFCANSMLKELFKGSGKYIRRKSAEYFRDEVKHIFDKYPFKSAFFCDDLFIFDINWLEKFSELYREDVRVPFICTGHALTIKERHAAALVASGCHTISFGVETGNEDLRKNVLRKRMSNNDLINSAKILKQHGIEIQTSNMFCLPDETVADALSTIKLNMIMGTDYMFTAIFLPFPKTSLANYCIEKGYLANDYDFTQMPDSFVRNSVLNMPETKLLVRVHKIAHLALVYPWMLRGFGYLIRLVPSDKLFFLLYLIGTCLRYSKERKLSFFETMKYLWTYRKGY